MKYHTPLRQLLQKYKHALVLLYFFIYMAWFTLLERTVKVYSPVHSRLDDFIPFNELFVIPYMLWFLYIFLTVAYFFFTSKTDYYKCCAYLFIGMTICLLIYTIWPNGHHLRVDIDSLGRKNIFINLISDLYTIDTATNVFPSIHVFNSIGALIAIRKSASLRPKKWLQWSALILTILIVLSTVFLKQHSVLDIFGALALNIVMYVIVYVPSWEKAVNSSDQELSNI